ncbi:MAG: KdsC family phosphatase [Desulfatiglandales bacterium]
MTDRIKLLVLDVDGVLTDGRIILNDHGEEIKRFHARDGVGLSLLMAAGIDVAVITGRISGVVQHRARELGITEIHQGVKDKAAIFFDLLQRKGLEKAEVCVVGDDLPDLPMFRLAGLAVAVADAALEVREAATVVTKRRGGLGAVREVCELILKTQGKWENALYSFK